MAFHFLYHLGRAVANQGLGRLANVLADPSPLAAGNLMGQIAADAWGGLRAERKQDRLNAEILAVAKMAFDAIRREAEVVALQVAPDDAEMRGHVERFITLVPACIRATLRRPEDASGTTLPYDYAVEDEADLANLLPLRFPREHFRPGASPPFLRGWELVEQLGAGGFGEVWKARNPDASYLVGAVKFGHGLNDAELALLNEGDVLNRLLAHGKHAGIVELQDCSLRAGAGADHVPWLRYEYVPGGDLSGLIHTWSLLPAAERVAAALTAFRELCETVGHFHRLSPAIVHRDLKPSNILVTADGRLKVGDFGIGSVSAKRVLDGDRRGTLSRTNTVQAYLRGAHTPLYAPPEQRLDPKHRPQPTDDVHALGVILFQMLTGRLTSAPGARFDRQLPHVPKAVVDLIGDCVDPTPAARPADAAQLVRRLTVPGPAPAPPPPDRPPLPLAPPSAEPPLTLTPAVGPEPEPARRASPAATAFAWMVLGALSVGTLGALLEYKQNGIATGPFLLRLALLAVGVAAIRTRRRTADLASALSRSGFVGMGLGLVLLNNLVDRMFDSSGPAHDATFASFAWTPVGAFLGLCGYYVGASGNRIAAVTPRRVVWATAAGLVLLFVLAKVGRDWATPVGLITAVVLGGILADRLWARTPR